MRTPSLIVLLSAVALGGCLASEPPGAHPGILVAFGDSVPAGHGLAAAMGYPGNSNDTYPALLADALGLKAYNMAISGACSGTSAEADTRSAASCTQSILKDEIPAVPADVAGADIVLVTVGANDIWFAQCLRKFMENDTANDPCRDERFAKHLDALETNLELVVARIEARLRPERLVMTLYYDILPAPTDVLADACDLWGPAAMARQPAYAFVPHDTDTFRQAVLDVQQEAWDYGAPILAALNGRIREVADRHAAIVVQLDASGHDMCATLRGGSVDDTWIYGPTWDDGIVDPMDALVPRFHSRPMPGPCPYTLQDPGVTKFPVGVTLPGRTVGYELNFHVNCMPHLTPTGHRAFSEQILQVLRAGPDS